MVQSRGVVFDMKTFMICEIAKEFHFSNSNIDHLAVKFDKFETMYTVVYCVQCLLLATGCGK